MIIIVSDIPEEGIDLELTDTVHSDTVTILSPVKAGLRFDKVEDEVTAHGSLSGDVELECSRCLKHYSQHIATPVNVVYHPAEGVPREEHHRELRGDELDTVFYADDEIDTDELLRDQLLLSIPMKPLCSAECRGICPKCGADRNTASCSCDTRTDDSRFSILKQLLEEKE